MRRTPQQPRAGRWHITGRSAIALWTKSTLIGLGSRGVTHLPVLSLVGIPSNRCPRLTLTGCHSSAAWELGGDCADAILGEGGDVTRRTLFLAFFFSFLIPFPSYIYTYKDHSLHIVVRRPYSGLTFRVLLFLPISTSVDCLVATAEHCLVSVRTGSGLTHCPIYL